MMELTNLSVQKMGKKSLNVATMYVQRQYRLVVRKAMSIGILLDNKRNVSSRGMKSGVRVIIIH